MSKRELIKSVAIDLFKRTGQVTIREIASVSGMNVNSVNYYFGNKKNLIAEIENEIAFYMRKIILDIESKEPTALEAKDLFIEAIVNFLDEAPGYIRYLLTSFRDNQEMGLTTLRDEINKGDLFRFLYGLIKSNSGIEDDVVIKNRLIIFYTSLATSIIQITTFSDVDKEMLLGQLANKDDFIAYLRELFDLIMKN